LSETGFEKTFQKGFGTYKEVINTVGNTVDYLVGEKRPILLYENSPR